MCCFIERTVGTHGPWKPLPPPGGGDFTASQPSLGATGPVNAFIRRCTTGAAVRPAHTSVRWSVRQPVPALSPVYPPARVPSVRRPSVPTQLSVPPSAVPPICPSLRPSAVSPHSSSPIPPSRLPAVPPPTPPSAVHRPSTDRPPLQTSLRLSPPPASFSPLLSPPRSPAQQADVCLHVGRHGVGIGGKKARVPDFLLHRGASRWKTSMIRASVRSSRMHAVLGRGTEVQGSETEVCMQALEQCYLE